MAGRGVAPSSPSLSTQDRVLMEHFLAFVNGAGGEWGPVAKRQLLRIILRAQATGNMASFGGYVARLIQADGAANGWG